MRNGTPRFAQLRLQSCRGSIPASFVIHALAILSLAMLSRVHVRWLTPPSLSPTTYYLAPEVSRTTLVYANIAPPDQGGSAGRGVVATKTPSLGSSAHHPTLTVVSNPPKTDFGHQLIVQSNSPPEVRIERTVEVPNVVIGDPLARLTRPLEVSSKPRIQLPKQEEIAAPTVGLPAVEMARIPAVEKPLLAVAAAPSPSETKQSATPAAKPTTSTSSENGNGAPQIRGERQGEKSLLALSTAPAEGVTRIDLPPGNKYGQFTFSPVGTRVGSPGGSGSESSGGGGGNGGNNTGDGSSGVGHGGSGGGGTSQMPTQVSVVGVVASPGAGAAAPGAQPAPAVPLRLGNVYPVPPDAPHVRKNAMIITSGATGGGGLDVYQALPCRRVYTVFLPMPVENWILQYCAPDRTAQPAAASGTTTMVRMEPPLVPPSPKEKFDFERLAIAAGTAQKNIVLRGLIGDDGAIADLRVHQGITQEMDETAKLAFNRWKFAPAMQAGKPVAVEILVGIPSRLNLAR